MSLRVLIAGGGLGGLTLAHALRRAGLHPLVFERGAAHADLSSSYRIHVDANGSRALRGCLPGDLWQAFELRSAASPSGITFVTERLRRLTCIPDPSAMRSHPISRAGLRQLLQTGLEDVIRFETRVLGYAEADGQVTVRLSDGSSASGDVLVGADGSASAIRKQLLPGARVVDTGVAGIAGKVYLDSHTRALISPRLLSEMTMVLPLRGRAMFLAPFIRATTESRLDLPEHLFWVVIGKTSDFNLRLAEDNPAPGDAQQQALHMVRGWHPLLGQLVEAADHTSLTAVPLHTAQPVAAWTTGRVTLLGDAIHTMTPLQGLGGNTALVDAAVLADKLVAVERGGLPLQRALAEYEASMRGYGFAAVQRSLQVSNAVSSHNVAGRLAFRTVLRVADRVPPLHRVLFARSELPLPEGTHLACPVATSTT